MAEAIIVSLDEHRRRKQLQLERPAPLPLAQQMLVDVNKVWEVNKEMVEEIVIGFDLDITMERLEPNAYALDVTEAKPVFIFTETMRAKVMPTKGYKYTFEFYIGEDHTLHLFRHRLFMRQLDVKGSDWDLMQEGLGG